MLNKYSTIALLGVTTVDAAASLVPTVSATAGFPLFEDFVAANDALAVVGTMNNIADTVSMENSVLGGPIYGIRMNNIGVPPQTLATAAMGATTALAATTAPSRTFWTDLTTQIGTYASTSAVLKDDTWVGAYPEGHKWLICATTITVADCTTFAGGTTAATGTAATTVAKVVKRFYIQKGQTGATGQTLISGGSPVLSDAYTWNQDLVLTAMYQNSWVAGTEVTDGTKWCSPFSSPLNTDGTVYNAKAYQNFGSKAKCTFQFLSPTHTQAPVVEFPATTYTEVMLHFVEWQLATTLGTGAVMDTGAAEGTFMAGLYEVGTDKNVYLQPMKAFGTAGVTAAEKMKEYDLATGLAYNDMTPADYWPGSVGTLAYYPGQAGYYPNFISSIDAGVIALINSKQQMVYDTFNNAKASSDTSVDNYDKALDDETARQADFFKATFEAVIVIPERPCPPSTPQSAVLPTMWKQTVAMATPWVTTAATQNGYASLKYTIGTSTTAAYVASDTFHNRQGFLLLTDNTAATAATDFQSSGHLWGVFGQSPSTMYSAGNKPFIFSAQVAASNPGINFTVFPPNKAQTAIAASKSVMINAKASDFAADTMYDTPGTPGGAKTPKSTGAQALFATTVAAAAVIASLQ